MRRMLQKTFRFLLIIALISCLLLLLLRRKYDEVMVSLTRTQVTNSTSDLINDAVAERIADGNIDYDRIIYFERNSHEFLLSSNILQWHMLCTLT